MKSTIYPWDHTQSQAGTAAWPDGNQPGTAARSEPFLRVASALFSTPRISEVVHKSISKLLVCTCKICILFHSKSSFEALATKQGTSFSVATGIREGRGGQAGRELESSLSRFSMTITFTSGLILECKLKQNQRCSSV